MITRLRVFAKAALATFVGCLFVSPAEADFVLFRNSPQLTASLASISDVDGRQFSADDFIIGTDGSYAITEVRWWGRFSGLTVPAAETSNFVLQLFTNAGTGPNVDPLISLTLGPVNRALVGTADRVSLFEFSLALPAPVVINGGERYFFSIFNDNGIATDPNFAHLWSSTSAASNPRWFRSNAQSIWTLSGSNSNAAFELAGSAAVPEPASAAMLGMGLVGVIGVAARRRNHGI